MEENFASGGGISGPKMPGFRDVLARTWGQAFDIVYVIANNFRHRWGARAGLAFDLGEVRDRQADLADAVQQVQPVAAQDAVVGVDLDRVEEGVDRRAQAGHGLHRGLERLCLHRRFDLRLGGVAAYPRGRATVPVERPETILRSVREHCFRMRWHRHSHRPRRLRTGCNRPDRYILSIDRWPGH